MGWGPAGSPAPLHDAPGPGGSSPPTPRTESSASPGNQEWKHTRTNSLEPDCDPSDRKIWTETIHSDSHSPPIKIQVKMNGSAAENNSFWKILVSLRKLFKPHYKPRKHVVEWGWGRDDWPQKWSTTPTAWPRPKSKCGCWGSVSQHRLAPVPWVPFLLSLHLQMGLHRSYDALDHGTRCEIWGLFFCPFLFFCTSSAEQKRPEFTLNLEHMKNITVHTLLYDGFVHFII